ncbi:MAG: hypothetical protein [Microviridae sp.]|nr:MAG: hypothetical protein [Microviridae sp.]
MKNENQKTERSGSVHYKGSKTEAQKKEAALPPTGTVPDLPTITDWVKRDLIASHYFLGVMIQHPDIVRLCAEQIMAKAKENESAGIVPIEKNQ